MNALLVLIASASLQQVGDRPATFPAPIPACPGAFCRRGGSTTAAGSYMEGMASIIRWAGYANLHNSIAARHYQEAYSRYLDNRLKAVETYYACKAVWEARKYARDQERREERLAYIQRHPPQLRPSHSELDPVTGDIHWPMMLRMDDFYEHRRKLDELFDQRAARGDLTYRQRRAVQQTVETWREELKEDKTRFPYEEYAESVKFIQRLGREVESRVGEQAVTQTGPHGMDFQSVGRFCQSF